MAASPHAWWDWGYGGIFACVFLEQIGVPIPAFPALLAAGALVASGELDFPGCLLTALGASLLADLIWYQIGRAQGGAVLSLMCRLSWRPDTCVSKTKTVFARYGVRTLLVSKFIPGLSVIAPPLSGISRVPIAQFVLLDGTGAVAWALVPLVAGAYMQKGLVAMETQLSAWKGSLPWLCGAAILAVLAWRYWRRRVYRRELARGAREGIDPEGLKSRLDRGEELTVIDVRDALAAHENPRLISQARWLPYTEMEARVAELALDRPIVVYCDCPHDEASVAMADWLRGHGAKEARPLRGGLEAWTSRGWPTDPWQPAALPAA